MIEMSDASNAHKSGQPEDERLQALRAYRILDTLPERAYDDVTELASFICGTPIALISFVEADRQWFKAAKGLSARETPRSQSFCAHTIGSGQTLIVADAQQDARFKNNPLVLGDPNIRFYAGAPIIDSSGHVLGTLCVIDTTARDLSPQQVSALEALSRQVMTMLEQHQSLLEIDAQGRKLAELEKASAMREEQLALTVEAAGFATWFFDPDRDVIGGDAKMEHLFGLSRPEGPANVWLAAIHEDDRERVSKEFAGGLSGAPYDTEYRVHHRESVRWIRTKARAFGNKGSIQMLGICEDITSRKMAEDLLRQHVNDADLAKEALRESENRFRMLADNMSQLAWTCDQLGNVTWYNRRWLDYTGRTFEEMAGWGWEKVQHPDHIERVVEQVQRSRDTGEVWEDTFPLRGRDGRYRWFLSRAIPIRDAAGLVVQWFGTNTDVTDNRLAEAALIKAEKLAAAGRLAFVLSHEINNPLQAVTNLLSILERSAELHDSTRTYAKLASGELARLSHLTRQSLAFYRDSTSPGPVNLQEAFDSVLDIYANQLDSRGIKVSRRYRSNIAIVSYAGEIRQIITTLLVNAMEATPTGGAIIAHVRPAGAEKDVKRPGVLVTIADTGIGIPEESLSRIFEPFFTTKGQQGSGLGLWVTQGIVSRLGGSIKVRSSVRPQKTGTVFSIFFPSHLPSNK